MKNTNILLLYWMNITRFWKTSFYNYEAPHSIFDKKRNELYYKKNKTREEEIWLKLLEQRDLKHSYEIMRTEVGSLPLWMFEFIFFVPSIIVFPVIRTIIDICTRKPLPSEEVSDLVSKLENLQEEDLEILLEPLSFDIGSGEHIFKSLNSRDLIADLHVARIEEYIKPEILEYIKNNNENDIIQNETGEILRPDQQKCYPSLPPKDESNEQYNMEVERWIREGDSVLYRMIYRKGTSINTEHQSERLQKQKSAIQAFLQNPENNGSKLAQYFHVNLNRLTGKQYDKGDSLLKARSERECARLRSLGSTCAKSKQDKITTIIAQDNLDEKKLASALLIHRGWGLFSNMTTAFDHVYCSHESLGVTNSFLRRT